MFGKYNDSILKKIGNRYKDNNIKGLKKDIKEYVTLIKEDKNLNEFFKIYDMFNTINFEDREVATEFVNESLLKLKSLDKAAVSKLIPLCENRRETNHKTIEYNLDQLVFNEKLSLKDRALCKVNLINQITNNKKEDIDFNIMYDKINERINSLNESEKVIIELFLENDDKKIKEYYVTLIEEMYEKVDNKILDSSDSVVIKRLVEVKQKLKSLKGQIPNIKIIENILDLKENFE